MGHVDELQDKPHVPILTPITTQQCQHLPTRPKIAAEKCLYHDKRAEISMFILKIIFNLFMPKGILEK